MKHIKTIEQVAAECNNGEGSGVYTISDFIDKVRKASFIPEDGIGFFHDGEKETNISVWDKSVTWLDVAINYPYVCWYNV